MEKAEQNLIDFCWNDPLCMNLAKWVAAPMRGRVGSLNPNYGKTMSEEQKELLRQATKEQWKNSDPRAGLKHSTESKAKISSKVQQALAEGRGGKFIPTVKTRAKMSKSLMGNTCAKGYKRTDAEKAAISERMKGNQNFLGKHHTEETKKKMSKGVYEITNNLEFDSLTAALNHFGLKMPTLRRALKRDTPITKGPCAGLWFRYKGLTSEEIERLKKSNKLTP